MRGPVPPSFLARKQQKQGSGAEREQGGSDGQAEVQQCHHPQRNGWSARRAGVHLATVAFSRARKGGRAQDREQKRHGGGKQQDGGAPVSVDAAGVPKGVESECPRCTKTDFKPPDDEDIMSQLRAMIASGMATVGFETEFAEQRLGMRLTDAANGDGVVVDAFTEYEGQAGAADGDFSFA